jgi:acyl-CoA synthetase (AMP-forming)/AMP-acid ligase II
MTEYTVSCIFNHKTIFRVNYQQHSSPCLKNIVNALSEPPLFFCDRIRSSFFGRIAQIVNDSGRVVERGATGELCTRGYSVMQGGYWGEPGKTAGMRAGWGSERCR